MIETIKQIFAFLKNLPAIIALLEQVVALIKSITGDPDKDETKQVAEAKMKMLEVAQKGRLRAGPGDKGPNARL